MPRLFECPYCGETKPSENGTGSDVACCGEVGHTGGKETTGSLVTLRCPDCGKSEKHPRAPIDPPGTEVVEIICYDCDDGDYHIPAYFDKDGKEIQWTALAR
jgi:hypothetical protein